MPSRGALVREGDKEMGPSGRSGALCPVCSTGVCLSWNITRTVFTMKDFGALQGAARMESVDAYSPTH